MRRRFFYLSINSGIPDNEIWYTTKNNNPAYISSEWFDAELIYNDYSDGKGVIVFNEAVTIINNYAFHTDTDLTSIILPNSITTIKENAFLATSIKSIILPNNLIFIGMECLAYNAINSIEIPNSVTTIEVYALIGNPFNSIIVEKGNSVYDSRENCNAIIETSSNTLLIGSSSTIIPNSITSINLDAFYQCSGLTSVEIPNSVTSIGVGAFADCYGLNSVMIGCSVTSIGDAAFSYCSSLTSVEIPNSVTSIGENAFLDCSGLTSITCKAAIPPSIYEYTFDGVDKSIPFYVPTESVDAYKSADYWSEFTNIQAIGGNEIITFYIGNTEYQAEEGMTWEEWCNSKYNTDGYYIGDYDLIYTKNSLEIIEYSKGNPRSSTIILDGEKYFAIPV